MNTGKEDQLVLIYQDIELINPLVTYLQKEGISVCAVPWKTDVYTSVNKKRASVFLLEFDKDGETPIDLLHQLKSGAYTKNIPVLFYTGLKDEVFLVAAYESGVDEVIEKPIKNRLLFLKIQVRLQQTITSKDNAHQLINPDRILINRERFVVLKGNKEYQLSRKEFELIELLNSKPGKVFSREEISLYVWDNIDVTQTRTIDVHIKKLRNKLGPETIKTIKGIGYCIG